MRMAQRCPTLNLEALITKGLLMARPLQEGDRCTEDTVVPLVRGDYFPVRA